MSLHSYFAYGSNLCVRQMAQRCPGAADPRPAVLADLTDLHVIPAELRGLHPDNPVNRSPGGGVQLELPARIEASARAADRRISPAFRQPRLS